jgi:hypothetical protein
MFLLTESTLFFLDRAVSSTTKKLSLGGHIKNWASNVPEHKTPSSKSESRSATSHAPTPPPSLLSTATTPSLLSTATSTSTSSKTTPAGINKETATKLDIRESDDVLMVSDVDSLDDHPDGLRKKGKKLVRVSRCVSSSIQSASYLEFQKSTTTIVPPSESDSEPEQTTHFTKSGGMKRKADDFQEYVDETASEAMDYSVMVMDDSQEMTVMPKVVATDKKEYAPRKTTSVRISFSSHL